MAIPNDTQMNFDFYLGPYSPYTQGSVFDPNVQRAWSASETFLPSYSQMQPPIGQDITGTFDNFHFPQNTAPRFAQYMGGVPDWNVMPNLGKLSFDSQAYFSQLPPSSLEESTKQIEQGLSSLSFSSNVDNEKTNDRRQSQQTWASVARPVSKDFAQRNQGPQRPADAGAYERRTNGRGNYRVCAPRSGMQSSQYAQNNCNSNINNTLNKGNELGSTSSTPVNANEHLVLQKLKRENLYNPSEFNVNLKGARFFVIKSYSEDDVHRSIKYKIWCSTEHGNKKLDAAFREREGKGPIYLFFSVNGSGHFCGVAEMMSPLDYDSKSDIWSQDKWRGKFDVKWIYVKDVPNVQLRNIRLENNENKPVTNSRDTQEVPADKGKQMLRIIHHYKHSTSIFDDFDHYEKRQREDKKHKKQIHNQHTQSSTLSQTNRPQ